MLTGTWFQGILLLPTGQQNRAELLMNIEGFVKSIYLGDRACKKIFIDSWSQELSIEIDTISRIRSADGNWNYYDAEDIENGQLVFGKVKKVFFDENGNIPNDRINCFNVSSEDDGNYCFTFFADSVADDGANSEVKLMIVAETIGLRDPLNPEVLITD